MSFDSKYKPGQKVVLYRCGCPTHLPDLSHGNSCTLAHKREFFGLALTLRAQEGVRRLENDQRVETWYFEETQGWYFYETEFRLLDTEATEDATPDSSLSSSMEFIRKKLG